ncbi:glycosyltransferase family 4 protein [Gulosibacter molinativorax]|uniref:Glycosyltransferase family 1 protein n=1 Tax=Gulosibacter molinativorax TaxID=256821 RepID=A0ABT7C7X3_9MICO|nr:glycosyltransferase family 1 protein [Gulosibacter molinativorax]MDJ1371321.1 glycosyltransferase family 1 protein [Gulosibacter molinativorax]QUY63615.1 Putative glycosyltransferase,mannosyltransferase [Gulosibacter molinativorax]
MVTLKYFVDELLVPVPGAVDRYAENLAREVIRRAPANCEVVGVVSQITPEQENQLLNRLNGISDIQVAKLNHKTLAKSWQHGLFTSVFGEGLYHAPSLFAPIRAAETGGPQQTIVTVSDTRAWTHPEGLPTAEVRWQKAQLKRAWQFADAVVTPTHALAEQVGELFEFRDRLRVVPGAAPINVRMPDDPKLSSEIEMRLNLPGDYILSLGSLEPHRGIDRLIRALALPQLADAVLVHAGSDTFGETSIDSLCEEAGVARHRVRTLGVLTDAELAVVFHHASVFCLPATYEGIGLSVLEAFRSGTPVVHSDLPALNEVSQGASLHVSLENPETFEQRLAIALSNVLHDVELQQTLTTAGYDRAPVYSWGYSGDLVWHLHADL